MRVKRLSDTHAYRDGAHPHKSTELGKESEEEREGERELKMEQRDEREREVERGKTLIYLPFR